MTAAELRPISPLDVCTAYATRENIERSKREGMLVQRGRVSPVMLLRESTGRDPAACMLAIREARDAGLLEGSDRHIPNNWDLSLEGWMVIGQ